MSKPTNHHSQNRHRKDNYSLEIKAPYRSGTVYTPFAKKRPIQQKLFLRLKTQTTHNVSLQASEKDITIKKRRLSLTKASKINHSVGIDNHLNKEKLQRINFLIECGKFQQALPIIRQVLMRQQNSSTKLKVSRMQAICYKNLGKLRQAEQIITRIIGEEPNCYQLFIERALLRFELSAKQLAVRDLDHAIYLKPTDPRAYLQLSHIYREYNEIDLALNIVLSALKRQIVNGQLYVNAIELLFEKKDTKNENIEIAKQVLKSCHGQSVNKLIASSQLMYMEGLIHQYTNRISEGCIYYEESIKNNNSKQAVTKALERLIFIKIDERDYYSAYHTINRSHILCINQQYLWGYRLFLEGVITILKKKFESGTGILQQILPIIEGKGRKEGQFSMLNLSKSNICSNHQKLHRKCRSFLHPLLLKFLGYAYFKLGKHKKSIANYQKLIQWGLDQCSSYNLLLAEGIVLAEKNKNFQAGIEKFEQAKYIYPTKVQPSLYIGMTVIYRDLCLNTKVAQPEEKYSSCTINRNKVMNSESLTSAVVHALQEMNDAFQNCNDSSSNLLFHRTILHLFLEDWEQAQQDISLCIQKAEENEPKYFYLRGLSYAVTKQIKKAINEYSISLSLNSQYHQSLLQRSKCYFLLGQTENGFHDLKQYMSKKPNDYTVHKWIGDLLYEGRSYEDAIKAYDEIDENIYFEAEMMKCKCLIRTGDIQRIYEKLLKLSSFNQCIQDKITVDIMLLGLLKMLNIASANKGNKTGQNFTKDLTKQLLHKIKKINAALEQNFTGYIFNLIDCMNLLGVATLYISNKYEESYQSFLLVQELYETLKIKNQSDLKSDCSQDNLSLHRQDILVNNLISLLGMKNQKQALKMISQLIQVVQSRDQKCMLQNLAQLLMSEQSNKGQLKTSKWETFFLQSQVKKSEKIKFRPIQLKIKGQSIKCIPSFGVFHTSAEDLYSQEFVKQMIQDLKPSYIDNMPEGPWIKRNEHGVVFTDHMIEDQGSSILLSSMRTNNGCESVSRNGSGSKLDECEREKFKKLMALDEDVEKKLNSIIQKSQRSN